MLLLIIYLLVSQEVNHLLMLLEKNHHFQNVQKLMRNQKIFGNIEIKIRNTNKLSKDQLRQDRVREGQIWQKINWIQFKFLI